MEHNDTLTKLYVEITTRCERFPANYVDCIGNTFPTCGGCLWAQGFVQCA